MTDDRALANALAFAQAGFGVFSVWNTTDGVCRCPKNVDCGSPGKHPIPGNGLKAATTDPNAIRRMLDAPGSQGQYGVVPGGDVIVIDVDGEGWLDQLAKLGLPKTFSVQTAKGVHLYFEWPPEYGPQPTRLFGWLVRSAQHPGYVIGPGSIHASGYTYRIPRQNGHATELLLAGIMPFPRDRVPSPGEVFSITTTGTVQPERISVGGRHDYLRDRARTLRGGGLTGQALEDAVISINARLPEPKTLEEVRQAIGDVETKFGEDPLPPPAVEVPQLPTSPHAFIHSSAERTEPPRLGDWLVNDLIRPGTIGLIAASTGMGKSYMRTELSIRLATGTGALFGHYGIPAAASVLIFEAENGEAEEWRREEDILAALGLTRASLQAHWRVDDDVAFDIDLNEPQHQDVVRDAIETYTPEVSFLDTVGTFSRGNEWGKEMHRVVSYLRSLVRPRPNGMQTSLVLTAHYGKVQRDKGKRPSLDVDDVMGQWVRFVDWVVTINPTDTDGKVRWQTFKRVPHTDLILEQKDGLWVTAAAQVAAPTNAKESRQQKLLGALMHGAKKVLGDGGLHDWLVKTGDGTTSRTVERDMRELSDRGVAESDESGLWSITEAGRSVFAPVRLSLVEGGKQDDA